jgi:hypothetical protein
LIIISNPFYVRMLPWSRAGKIKSEKCMSNSERHQNKRRQRAKQKAKNIMQAQKNAPKTKK